MKLLDLTLPTPAENVALDEALLDAAEAGELAGEILRLWESPQPVVIVGRSSRAAEEVNLAACEQRGVPVLRRASGGAAILAGPGCLMYALILPYAGREHLRLLDQLHQHVLGQLADALRCHLPSIERAGTSDLAVRGQKVSGNSVRCKRDHFLYHGTLLYDFDLLLLAQLLAVAPRQPAYRAGRAHREFVANLGLPEADLRQALITEFAAHAPLAAWPQRRTGDLVAARYAQSAWNQSR